jgi:phospholipid/cholesterol/gamma-HCH transport system substrate-binding protein
LATSSAVGRIAAVVALLGAAVAAAIVLRGSGGDSYEVTAKFENASQLVGGEQVVVAGTPAGKVTDIALGSNGEALVTFSVDEAYAPLERGTTATVRSFSLSGIANRQVELTLPATGEAGGEIPDGGVMEQSETVSEVDLDEIFNTLNKRTVDDLKKVITGLETSYDGVGKQANRGFKYLNPFLSTSRRVFGELTRDERTFERLLVDTSRLSGALAARRDDVSQLVGNLNGMMGALGRQKEALARSVGELPDFMRSFNTTAVTLRAALDDLDPLVDASKPVAVKLRPFFREFRGASNDLVPAVRDLDAIVKRKGADNDLVELTRLAVPLASKAVGQGSPDCGDDPSAGSGGAADDDFEQGAFGESTCALRNSLPNLSLFRPYTPELVGWFDDFGHSGFTDANGGIGRISTTLNTFSLSAPDLPILDPTELQTPLQQAGLFDTGNLRRCPGALERDPGDGSTPFGPSNGGPNCDESDVPTGP